MPDFDSNIEFAEGDQKTQLHLIKAVTFATQLKNPIAMLHFRSFLLLCVLFLAQSLTVYSQATCTTPADHCTDACTWCTVHQYSGTTAPYTAGVVNGFCGSIENEQWMRLIAHHSSVEITGTAISCNNWDGIQIALLRECDGVPIACWMGSAGQGQTPAVISAPMEPGEAYLLLVDGWAGDICDFTLSVSPSTAFSGTPTAGIFIPNGTISGPDTLCPSATGTYSFVGLEGVTMFNWSGTPGTLVNGRSVPVAISGDSSSVWQITTPAADADSTVLSVLFANTCTDTVAVAPFTHTIYIHDAPRVVYPDTIICGSVHWTPWNQSYFYSGTYYGVLPSTVGGCDTIAQQTVYFGTPAWRSIDTLLCNGAIFTACGDTFSVSGTYTTQCTSYLGCDSVITVNVRTIEQYSLINFGNEIHPCQNDFAILQGHNQQQLPQYQWTNFWTDSLGNVLSNADNYTPTAPGLYLYHVSADIGGQVCAGTDSIRQPHISQLQGFDFNYSYDCTTQSEQTHFIGLPLTQTFGYQWTGPLGFSADSSHISVTVNGDYQVVVSQPDGQCTSTYTFNVPIEAPASKVVYRLWLDQDSDCTRSAADTPLAFNYLTLREATNPFSAVVVLSDQEGYIEAYQPAGTIIADANFPYTNCPQSTILQTCQDYPDTVHVLMRQEQICPKLEVNLFTPQITRCFNGQYKVNVYNAGNEQVDNVQIWVEMDTALQFVSATAPIVSQSGSTYGLHIGYVGVGASHEVVIDFQASCAVPIGYTHCTKVTALPDNVCTTWAGPVMDVNAMCQGDSIKFTLRNKGQAASAQPHAWYWIALDDLGNQVATGMGTVALAAAESADYTIAALGSRVAIVVEQSSLYPYTSQSGVEVKGCNVTAAMQAMVEPIGFGDEQYDVFCINNIGSFDPNDKTAYPQGTSDEHYIDEGSDLVYAIRFQNTGTAPAQNIVIRDTLPRWLDLQSARITGYSHWPHYGFEPGGVVVFNFNSIWLPDSTSNPEGSQGYVTFRVKQVPGTPFGEQFRNSAAIYFDFNDPIITNTTLQTNGIPRPTSATHTPASVAEARLSPNPFSDALTVSLDHSGAYRVELFDAYGKLCISRRFQGNTLTINDLQSLASGMYWLQVRDLGTGRVVAAGKAVRQ